MKFCRRIASSLVIGFLSYLLIVCPANAQEEFNVSFDTTYSVNQDGNAEVVQQITLQNKLSQVYANSYTLTLEGKKPRDLKIVEGKENLNFEAKEEGFLTEIVISFPNALVGKDKSRTFTVTYTLSPFAQKNGEVWEVSLPKIVSPELISEYKLTLEVPRNFGEAAYISPQPYYKGQLGSSQIFQFTKDDLTRAGVVAAFGESQIFTFDLTYHIDNPNAERSEVEIALLPDTAYQRVYYESITPSPRNIKLDVDGNWIATYLLEPNENVEVRARVSAQIFAEPQNYYPKIDPLTVSHYLSQTDIWTTTDPEIVRLAGLLKSPRSIHNFVVGKLNYDYSRVQENITRLGVAQSLAQPDRAICMEFTDLFVTIARASGNPAREINGYAYTENPQIQPLSLVADVLHSWPEYWDSQKNVWQPIDPTWEDTTQGIDFFNKFDLSHVTFVIHGKDSKYPYPAGSYKDINSTQKDVQVQFGVLPENKNILPQITVEKEGIDIPFMPIKRKIIVNNPGAVALYNIPLSLSSAMVFKGNPFEVISFLPPLSVYEENVEFSLPLIPNTTKATASIALSDANLEYNIETTEYYILQTVAIFVILLIVSLIVVSVFHLSRKS